MQPHGNNATCFPFRGTTRSYAGDVQRGNDKVQHACPTEVDEWNYWDGSTWQGAGEDLHLNCVVQSKLTSWYKGNII